ncbi:MULTISPECIES: pyruvate, phosphate dikinase [Prosthecochloris]|uniref:Pyruvate, phosphate dikinase n=1 Tax=Prosthecochloris vibrioformis TaxID=1098 RepID=A0A5C4S4K4_PROVB|nr:MULTISPECIES: pyruvate, phosphate dikinase [Prosthecochloris]ANT65580.1 Pyruvate, phosphate dikinase [Prosthecochloris sp. CIB 2401]TNJ38039.1 pyruvate, phosphate dikinase [Prosthecochloris vibrioformis]
MPTSSLDLQATSEKQYIYTFTEGGAEGDATMKNLLGGKGANLAEMANLGLPVPPGFTISTEVCTYYYEHGKTYPSGLLEKTLPEALASLESTMGKKLGDPDDPLLVSVRSGARASMPGMMDTILNLGLNDRTVEGLAERSGNPRFAWDCYRRFVQMYGDVVMELKPVDARHEDPFEEILDRKKAARGIELDTELDTNDLKELVGEYKQAILDATGMEFPEDPLEQLKGAIGAVFGSWNNERAIIYRKLNHIPGYWGTACNVQAMVFGNMGESSGTGVAFTRDAASGENIFYGEYLMNAQGEDVVAGTRTPLPITDLKAQNPAIYAQLDDIRMRLEQHYRDMMDIEFTIENGRLFMLQCRVGKRTGLAAVRIAYEMQQEGLIDEKEAILRIDPEQLVQLLKPVFDRQQKEAAISEGRLLAKGLNAGPGAATGKICFSAQDARELSDQGEQVILVRIETSPEDIKGMAAAEGILTQRGGMTSHAALVARQMGKVCIAGCGDLKIDYRKGELHINGAEQVFKEGDYLSLDGTTGEVIAGKIETRSSEVIDVLETGNSEAAMSETWKIFNQFMRWADTYRKLRIRTNADQPDQAKTAIAFGAEGIGLCRTEHMFFGGDRIDSVREMILADTREERKTALEKLLPYQREDFYGLFKAMGDRPVTIRLLDPPLHEFLPHEETEIEDLSRKINLPLQEVLQRIDNLRESNPMLGLRGCRLGILYPEIPAMQVRAIMEAACRIRKEGHNIVPEIMVPLVSTVGELEITGEIIHKIARRVMAEQETGINYLVGTMIEVPRAALTSGDIAKHAEFFSYGTNDLTQMGLGMSRDDAGQFLPTYQNLDIFHTDPFCSLDQDGVGRLMKISAMEGRKTNPDLKLGICGEQGGDPATISFCHSLGLNYVSCSPYRIPIAKMAAARAALG